MTTAIRDAIIDDAEAYRDMYLNVLEDLDNFEIAYANARVAELTSFDTTNDTPWSGLAVGKAVATKTFLTTIQPHNVTHRETTADAQVDFTTAEANAWHVKVNAQVQAQVTLHNEQNIAKTSKLTAEHGAIQTGVELGITAVDRDGDDQAFDFSTTRNLTQAPNYAATSNGTDIAVAIPSGTDSTNGQQAALQQEAPAALNPGTSPAPAPEINEEAMAKPGAASPSNTDYVSQQTTDQGDKLIIDNAALEGLGNDIVPPNYVEDAVKGKEGFDPETALAGNDPKFWFGSRNLANLMYDWLFRRKRKTPPPAKPTQPNPFDKEAPDAFEALDAERRFANGDIKANQLHSKVLQFAMENPAVWKALVKRHGKETIRLFSIISAWGWNISTNGTVTSGKSADIDASAMTATIGESEFDGFTNILDGFRDKVQERSPEAIADLLYKAIHQIYQKGKPDKLPSTLGSAEWRNASGLSLYAAWTQATAFRQEFLGDLAKELKLQAAFAGAGIVLSNLDKVAELGYAARDALSKTVRKSSARAAKRFLAFSSEKILLRQPLGIHGIRDLNIRARQERWAVRFESRSAEEIREMGKAKGIENVTAVFDYTDPANIRIYLSADTTAYHAFHELSHYFDLMGIAARFGGDMSRAAEFYKDLSAATKEILVYKRLQSIRKAPGGEKLIDLSQLEALRESILNPNNFQLTAWERWLLNNDRVDDALDLLFSS